ncbi:MAG: hypothetical protein LKF30_11975 [Sphingobium sp.]|jgi:hypothetical protein|nr:hypothetical protein [Sphingobium sp.]MCI1271538.1 hypothetical protein [Sphingobium sp.]MCI1756820.1 hypothetical protein [Sphingobium sp.]MCI2052401.1 hypothetical protein [Sphingobium sp.]
MVRSEKKNDWARWLLGALLIGLLAYGWWHWSDWRRAGETGASYAARLTCSCRYIGGRDAKSCARDIRDDAWMASVNEEPEEKAVRASVPLLGSARAVFRPGYGCLIESPSQR